MSATLPHTINLPDDHQQAIAAPALIPDGAQQEIRIDFTNLSFTIFMKNSIQSRSTPALQKNLIKDLTGSFGNGLNAILGGSGAGKTTFLNLLAKKINPGTNGTVTGTILANGQEYTGSTFKDFASFVMQDDHLLATMTVRECLQFSADMKLAHLSEADKLKRVDEMIRILMLSNCQNSFIGDALNKGISGGERKRCSIGVELIGDPQVLFLDEPTSGLDSFTAFQILNALCKYSDENSRTIIFTIHSPSSDIWNLFDSVTLLAEGNIIYSGIRSSVLEYFSNHGFNCPRLSNPADYFLDVLQNLPSEQLEVLQQEHRQYQLSSKPFSYKTAALNGSIKRINHEKKKFTYVISRLLKRQMLNIKRNRILLRARMVQSFTMNILLGLIFLNISKDTNNNEDAFNLVKMCFLLGVGSIFQGMNPQVITFSIERAVILKEQDSGMYDSFTYFLSKILPELINCSMYGSKMVLIMYFMVGFYPTAGQFFFFMLVMAIMNNVGNAIGIIASASFNDPKVAVVSMNLFMIPIMLFGGIFKNLNDMYSWVSWLRFLSPTYYQICSLAESQLDGSGFSFDYVNYLKLDFGMWGGVLMLVLYYFVANFFGYCLLLAKRTKLQ